MSGTLYGIGVGPGDPELLTLKAARLIRECAVIAVPGGTPAETMAYRIALQAIPEIAGKRLLGIDMPMTKDEKILAASHRRGADRIEEILREGEDVAFLTIGDPGVYSTYLYLHRLVGADGYAAELVSGVPSFCAAAARLNLGLAEKSDEMHIIPSSYGVEKALKLPGTKILMKAGRKMPEVKSRLTGTKNQVWMVENCGMEGERIFRSAEEIPEDAGYYSLIIVKEEDG